MQLTIGFDCRECGEHNEIVWDTAGFTVDRKENTGTQVVDLVCEHCIHVSGELRPAYTYRAEHRPRHESAPS